MIKVWTKFLSGLCSEGNTLRNSLGKCYKRMISKEKAYHTLNGKPTEHETLRRGRRRITFEPTGQEVEGIPENAVPSEEIEE